MNNSFSHTLPFQKVRIPFETSHIHDVEAAVRNHPGWSRIPWKHGARIAVAVGSRGIANLATIVRSTIACLQERGCQPFIVPAMGSHGGATAHGQIVVLESYGITERAMGCPILSSMETVALPIDGLPVPAFMDRHAWNSDGVVIIGRIKPHTDFHGPYESGLAKMTCIGLGKERQAFEMHRHGVQGLRDFMPQVARGILGLGKILAGIAILENARDETAHIEVLPAGEIMDREPGLLDQARKHLARLPFDDLDVLIIDHMGKDISGAGVDTNVIGRLRIPGEPEPSSPRIRMIVITDLTHASHGNAVGVGLADVISRRLFEKIDLGATRTNVVTSAFLERGKIPVVAETDLDAVSIALRASGARTAANPRMARIRNTLSLEELYLSPAMAALQPTRPGMKPLGQPGPVFDAQGALLPF